MMQVFDDIIKIPDMSQLNELQRLFFHDDPAKRQKWFDLFQDPVWVPKYNVPLDEMREQSMQQLRCVARAGIVSVTDFFHDPTNIFTAHEQIGTVASSTTTKFTVHYNLFGRMCLIQVALSLHCTASATSFCFR